MTNPSSPENSNAPTHFLLLPTTSTSTATSTAPGTTTPPSSPAAAVAALVTIVTGTLSLAPADPTRFGREPWPADGQTWLLSLAEYERTHPAGRFGVRFIGLQADRFEGWVEVWESQKGGEAMVGMGAGAGACKRGKGRQGEEEGWEEWWDGARKAEEGESEFGFVWGGRDMLDRAWQVMSRGVWVDEQGRIHVRERDGMGWGEEEARRFLGEVRGRLGT